jgi:hypothetical protein
MLQGPVGQPDFNKNKKHYSKPNKKEKVFHNISDLGNRIWKLLLLPMDSREPGH